MRLLNGCVVLALAVAAAGFADTLTLRSGRTVNGTYLGGSARQVRMEVGDRIETYDTSEVVRIEFGRYGSDSSSRGDNRPTLRRAPDSDSDSRPTMRRAPDPDSTADERPTLRRTPSPILKPDPVETAGGPGPAPLNIELPAGTNIVVRMIDAVDSERNRVGQTFQASLDEPVIVNGETALPRGTDAMVKLVDDKESGKLSGKTVLTLDLVSVRINGRMVDLNTMSVQQSSASRTGRTGKVVGGGAALGAIIGGIAGGGKGAAVGAASGAAVGAGAQVITKGQQVKIPSETRLTFALDTAIKI